MGKATIKLYGDISSWNNNGAARMPERITEAALGAEVVDMHIHSYGGAVLEGNALCNAIRNSPVPVDAYIDGVAASMASIVALAARKVYMSENAFLMIHAPSGCVNGRGTAAEHTRMAKALAEMEKNFVKVLTAKTGKDEKAVRAWLEGDNWFSAQQALEAGLIDGIVDPIAKEVTAPSADQVAAGDVESIYAMYTACLTKDSQPKNNNMDKQQIIDTLGLTGVTAASSDADIMAAMTAKLNAEKEAKKKAEDELKAQKAAQITAKLDEFKDKLTTEQRKQYQAVGEQMGIEALDAVLVPLAAKPTFSAMIAGSAGQPTPTAGYKTFDEYMEKDPAGLEALAETNYEAFNALYRAKFGTDAPKN